MLSQVQCFSGAWQALGTAGEQQQLVVRELLSWGLLLVFMCCPSLSWPRVRSRGFLEEALRPPGEEVTFPGGLAEVCSPCLESLQAEASSL